MRQVTATGPTVDEAVQSALQQLNTERDQVNIEVIDEGKRGLLKLFGSKPAIVKVTIASNPIEQAEKYLKSVITDMGVEAEIQSAVKEKDITFQLTGEKIAILIGKRGQTLNALQYLVHLVINKKRDQYYNVIVDAEGYRERRKETLVNLADRLADKAVTLEKEVTIEPMPSFERKIIHTRLQNHPKVSTFSAGTEPNRHVIIKPSK